MLLRGGVESGPQWWWYVELASRLSRLSVSKLNDKYQAKAMMLYVLMLKTFWMLHKIVVSVIIVAVKDIFDDTINVVIKSNDVVFTSC